MKDLSVFLITLSLPFVLLSGWERTYTVSGYDIVARSVIQTADGGYACAGWAEQHGSVSIFLMKTDWRGDTLWTRFYEGLATDPEPRWNRAYSISQTVDGGYIIVGSSSCYGAEGINVLLLRTNQYGEMMWARTYYGSFLCEGLSVVQTVDEGFIFTAFTLTDGIFVVRTDPCGDTLWSRNYLSYHEGAGISVLPSPDGGFFIVGYTLLGSFQACWLRIDDDGELLSENFYGLPSSNVFAVSADVTHDRGLVIACWVDYLPDDTLDFLIIRTDRSGDIVWSNRYSLGALDIVGAIVQAHDGGYVLAGGYYPLDDTSALHSVMDVFLMKTDYDGNIDWIRFFGGDYYDCAYSLFHTADSGYIIAGGYDERREHTDAKLYLIKTDSEGHTPIIERAAFIPMKISLDVSPNPFNCGVKISANIPLPHIEILDLMGRLIDKLEIGEQVWRPEASIGSGVYLVRATVGEQSITKRVVYLK